MLNRADSAGRHHRDDVLAIIGREPDVLVPSDREIPRSVNEGKPIALAQPRSEAAQAFRALADVYAGRRADGTPGASQAPAPASSTEEAGLMELHERLGDLPGAAALPSDAIRSPSSRTASTSR